MEGDIVRAETARFGDYEIVSVLGKGRAGDVWKARDLRLNRDAAVRIAAQSFSERFRHKVRAVMALKHPHLCALYDVGPNYLAMELVEGPTLAEQMNSGPVALDAALAIAKQIAEALAVGHREGLVHGDLRPGHVRIGAGGAVKVMDFGLTPRESVGYGVEETFSTDTRTATMSLADRNSPRAETAGKDADIRAFGAILYEMLTGCAFTEQRGSDATWERVPAGARRLLRACLTQDSRHRLLDIGAIDWKRGGEPVPTTRSWGPFLLLEKVGQGGFGEVYRARDPKLDREVAVKLLRTRENHESDYRAILREARLIAKVRHPNIVSVYGVECFDGLVGFWSDFVDGKNLSDLLFRQGPFGAREAAAIGIEVCRALSAMHTAGLLHLDVKASNVMREQGGRILLMDFGLSAEASGGVLMGGSPQYMAPELFRGSAPTLATDIYALGVLLFFLTTGRYPVDSARGSSSRRRLIDERPDLPEAFSTVVETAIAEDPERRFSTAGEMMAALANWSGDSQPFSVQPEIRRTWKRWQFWVAALLLVSLAALGYGVFARGHKAPAGANQDYVAAEALLQREDKPDNVGKAIALYGKAIGDDPKFALAHSGLARAYLLRNRASRSPEFLEKAAAEGQKALELGADLAPVHVTMGLIYTAMSRYDLAASELDRALQLDGTSAEAHVALAKLYAAQGRTKDVVPNFLQAIVLGPDDWRWPNQLGIYYLSTGKNAEASEQFGKVVALTRDNIYGFQNLGISYRRQERYPEAEAALKQALKLDPHFAPGLNTYGNLLMAEGRYTEAARIYGQAVELAAGDYLIRANLASAYQWSPGMKDKARTEYLAVIEMAEKLRKVQPRDPGLLADLGAYYAAVGNEAKALPFLREALALAPENPDVLERAGEGFELTSHRKEAISAIAKALKLGYPAQNIRLSPELADLRKDPNFLAIDPRLR